MHKLNCLFNAVFICFTFYPAFSLFNLICTLVPFHVHVFIVIIQLVSKLALVIFILAWCLRIPEALKTLTEFWISFWITV